MSAERVEGQIGWARDFDEVWHRMSSGAWAKGVGPADPVACCGKRIDSVDYSTIDPRNLDDGDEVLCVPLCAHCRRPLFVNAADGVAYHEATAERECHDYEGTTLARTEISTSMEAQS